ncbi:hypothetical protein VTJ83DRAFT_5794 [Remersonia thermophila]|uniref:Uncharacterized protein n=1 Tax=Remersonia thermophila TaxID=72144 RepID=A0ABR4D847_9PEZI
MSHMWTPEPMADAQYARTRPPPMEPASNAAYTHSRTRTTSSNVFPFSMQPTYSPNPDPHPNLAPAPPNLHPYQPQQQQQQQQQPHYHQPPPIHLTQPSAARPQRRSPSVNTFSTISSGGGMPPPAAYRTSPTLDIRRSTSSRSGGVPGSPHAGGYVAFLRKQKATVWCDRAQHEDPRLLAQQRAAKQRANMELLGAVTGLGIGSISSGRTATGLSTSGKVAAKIRHHGKPTVIGYSPGSAFNGVGGVPLRLSATEVEGEESDDDDPTLRQHYGQHHRRTGSSGRNSIGSAGRRTMTGTYRTSGSAHGAPASRWSPGDTPERRGSLADGQAAATPASAAATPDSNNKNDNNNNNDAGSAKHRSVGSRDSISAERLDTLPELGSGHLAANSMKHAAVTREKSVKSVDELRRRGSVDERTMTLTTGRLYIANPD